jgi:hypothetical protein
MPATRSAIASPLAAAQVISGTKRIPDTIRKAVIVKNVNDEYRTLSPLFA